VLTHTRAQSSGAHYPTSTKIDLGQEQARLFGFIQGFMSEPDTAWYVMRNAVKFQDYNMVQQVMSRYVWVVVGGRDRPGQCSRCSNQHASLLTASVGYTLA